MPTRSASDYLSYVKAQVLTQTPTAVPQARNILRYQGNSVVHNAVTQFSDMAYLTRGQAAPTRDVPLQVVQTRSNPKALSQVSTLSGGGVLGGVVSRPQPRTSGTNGLVVPQTNLIQFPGSAR